MDSKLFAASFTIFFCFSLASSNFNSPGGVCAPKPCGKQLEWLNKNGSLNTNIPGARRLDLAHTTDLLTDLMKLILSDEDGMKITLINYVSFANNGIARIPLFTLRFLNKTNLLSQSIEYLSLLDNDFSADQDEQNDVHSRYDLTLDVKDWVSVKTPITMQNTESKCNWATDLMGIKLTQLKELDLRKCRIEVIQNGTFSKMPELRYLYLQHNNIHQLESEAFKGLRKLIYLDLSENEIAKKDRAIIEGLNIMEGVFTPLKMLVSLDLSYTKIIPTCINTLKELGRSLRSLSLCLTQITSINSVFVNTKLNFLDISGNIAMKDLNENFFNGIEDTLEFLYARQILMTKLDHLIELKMLKVLSVSGNNIPTLKKNILQTMKNLVILDVSDNRISSWYEEILAPLQYLEVLQLQNNNINLLSPAMLEDFERVHYLGIGHNDFVCNCYLRHFIDTAKTNSEIYNISSVAEILTNLLSRKKSFVHKTENMFAGVEDYYVNLIENRNTEEISVGQYQSDNLAEVLHSYKNSIDGYRSISEDYDITIFNFTYVLTDYSRSEYTCTDAKSNVLKPFIEVEPCKQVSSKDYYKSIMDAKTSMMVGLILMVVLILTVCLLASKWWYVRYFFVMMKNTTVLSFFGKDGESGNDVDKIFIYDVFVSYCNGDRKWVIDELLPHIEHDKTITVCLHERDFQVGLSILENIISCVDRSKSILLVVSEEFLLSQWCQFEMHLAQHRLLETRREQLILVLLEDIPKTRRPNTLHYLMMTKTYLVWPKAEQDISVFWKRLRKALVQGKMRPSAESISSA